ncbi:unnamed protein product [Brassicogethes aeneus]|uniref:Uncharacterized protein n=1 Tax=Brassicogethes aeneus TaxID=1431903 RepID=A0A9P0B7W3_BRAAE|nr:unnamed protein product [Brassicogethes aeneus]
MNKVVLLFNLIFVINVNSSESFIKEKMEADGIIPDSIDVAPSAKITVVFDSGKEVDFGHELTPTEVKNEPTVKWEADPSKYYVLSMVDPDAPSRADPKVREYNHWLVGNIPGSDVSSPVADVISPFQSSGPPKGTGLHRYIFLVYEQKEKLTFEEPRGTAFSRINRFNFSIRKFAKKYNFGNPVAGNYYQCQWDEYVEERAKKITE